MAAKKTLETVGGIDQFDQIQALVLERLRELPMQKDLPKAFVLALPAVKEGQAAVELVTCCPTDRDTEMLFMSMTLSTVYEWAKEVMAKRSEEGEEEEDE